MSPLFALLFVFALALILQASWSRRTEPGRGVSRRGLLSLVAAAGLAFLCAPLLAQAQGAGATTGAPDFTSITTALFTAWHARNYALIVVIVAPGVTFLARRYLSILMPWLHSPAGGVALVVVPAVFNAFVSAVTASGFNGQAIATAVVAAVLTALTSYFGAANPTTQQAAAAGK